MNIVFDAIILLFLLADAFVIYLLFGKKPPKRKALYLFLAISAFLTVFYGSFIEPRLLVVKEYEISLNANPTNSIKIALASDFHVGPYKKTDFVEKVVSVTLELKPDIVVLAGDFVFDDKEEVKFLEPLGKLSPLGVFAILGNHDYGSTVGNFGKDGEERARAVRQKLKSLGITVLVNGGANLNGLQLFGTDELWTERASISDAFNTLGMNSAPHPSILISHNPDIIHEAQKKEIDLVLSGHTHAGQIRLPFIGPVPNLPDELGRDYDKGFFEFGDTKLFITPGVGEMGPRARLFGPPEIDLLNIKY